MKSILALTRYDQSGASSRLRFYAHQEKLLAKGYEIHISPLLKESYVKNLYAGKKKSIFDIFNWYMQRFLLIFQAKKYDFVWIEKEVFPGLPLFFDKLFLLFFSKYIIDIDDAVYLNYQKFPYNLFENKIGALMKTAKAVLAGSTELKNFAIKSGSQQNFLIPTAVDSSKYSVAKSVETKEHFCVGWIGSPATEKYLLPLEDVFLDLQRQFPQVQFRFIGITNNCFARLKPTVVTWTAESELSELSRFHIGIMPLPDTEWERGKCGFKLIQYMAATKAVLASPVGFNRDIVTPGVNGFFADTPQEWREQLSAFVQMPELERQRMGEKGHALFLEKFSTHAIEQKIIEIFSQL